MNKEAELTRSIDNPDFLVMAGSRLYGTKTQESDHDYRGFTIPPFEYLAGLARFEQKVIREPDIVIYSLKRFFELLISGDPLCYEILFAPEPNIIERTDVGGTVLRNRSLFACKQFARRIGGYAESEWRKVTGTQLVPIKRTSNEDTVVENIRQVFHPGKESMDEIIRLLFMNHQMETRKTNRKLGAKRKKQIKLHGYCTSSACHTIRLLDQLKELMDTGNITFPCPRAELLLSIKQGELNLDEVSTLYEYAKLDANNAEKGSDLPDKPPVNQIHTLYNEIIADAVLSNPRAIIYKDRYAQRNLKAWQ